MKGGENKKTKGTLYNYVQYEQGCAVNQAHLQYKQGRSSSFGYREGGTTQKYSPINKALILLICQVQIVADGRLQKSVNQKTVHEIFSF